MNHPGSIVHLIENLNQLKRKLKKLVADAEYTYETFGKEVEKPARGLIVASLTDGRFITSKTDYEFAKNKNYFPDLSLTSRDKLAIEIKSGCRRRTTNGESLNIRNSQNDMGTIASWPEKLSEFDGDKIYYVFIEYELIEQDIEVSKITIDRFYKFLGLNSAGMLSYREKDGNLRPRDFDETPRINSLTQFSELLIRTSAYRSKRIIYKHYNELSAVDRLEVREKLSR